MKIKFVEFSKNSISREICGLKFLCYMLYLAEENLWRQKVELWLMRAGRAVEEKWKVAAN